MTDTAHPKPADTHAGDPKAGDNASHFGFRPVDPAAKQGLVNGVFRRVAGRYDLMNDLMSVGCHRLWKDAMVAWLAPPKSATAYRALDMAGGTADIALRIAHRAPGGARVLVADISEAMLQEGAVRAAADRCGGQLSFACMNAETLPFAADHFDAYTIAFGIRNVPDLDAALGEAYRVLKPGGRFLCLEFSQVVVPVLDDIYERWSFGAIPRIGAWVTGDRASYQYLVESIRKFPNQQAFARRLKAAGFARVAHRNLTGGIVAMHSGFKI